MINMILIKTARPVTSQYSQFSQFSVTYFLQVCTILNFKSNGSPPVRKYVFFRALPKKGEGETPARIF